MIYFSDFSVAGGAVGAFAVHTFETGTTETTTLSITDSTFFGGGTPACALVFGGYHQPANDPAETAHAGMSVGFSVNGELSRYTSARSQDNVASTVVSRITADTYCYGILHRSSNAYLKRFNAGYSANTFNLGRISNTDANMRGFVAVFEAATQATSGVLNLGTGTSAITVTPGFRADAVILLGNAGPNNSFGSFCAQSFGIATASEQRCALLMETNGAASGDTRMAILSTAAAGQIDASTGAISYSCSVGNFTSTSFDVTPNANAGSDVLIWIALKFDNRNFDIIDITTPTSTGAISHTGAAFTPSCMIGALTNLEAVDTAPGATSDLSSGLAYILASGSDCYTAAIRIDSGADPTDTASNLQSGILQPGATNTAAGKATFSGFVSGGFGANWTSTQGAAKKGFALVIE